MSINDSRGRNASPMKLAGGLLPALILLGLLIPLVSTSSQVPPPPAAFTKRAATPGLLITEKEHLGMQMTVNVLLGEINAGKFSMSEQEEKDKLVKVLKVNPAGHPGELQVKYEKASSVSVEQGKTKTTVEAVQGKTYVIKAALPGKTGVSYPGGRTEPPAAEAKLVKKDFANLEKSFIVQELVGKTLTPGQKVPELEAALHRYAGSDDDVEVQGGNVVFKGTRACGGETCGVFSVSMLLSGVFEQSLRMEVPLNGEMVVRLRGAWPVILTMEGPIKISGEKQVEGKKMILKGGGRMKVEYAYAYK